MNVLVLGGSGLLGGPAARALTAAGYAVTVLTRGGRALPPGVEPLVADRSDPAALAAALGGRAFGLTIDLLAYDAPDVEALLDVPGFAPGRYVMISTGQVYLVAAVRRPPSAEADGELPAMAEPTPETRAHANWVYGTGKRRAEAAVARRRAAGLDTVILRLPVVQGAGDASRRLWAYLQRLLDGGPLLVPDGGEAPLRWVWAEDVARLLVALAGGLPTPSPVYNVAMPEERPLVDLLRLAAAELGVAPALVPCTEADLVAAGLDPDLSPFSGPWCSRPDPRLAGEELGFVGTRLEEWLPAVVRAHLAEHDPRPHYSYEHREREIALAQALTAKATPAGGPK